MIFRFVHAADLHLGFPFETCFPRAEAEHHRSCHFAAFDQLTAGILRSGADFVLFAGDVFDRNYHCPESRERFLSALKRFQTGNIRVWIAAGNHDPLSEWKDLADRLPDNVRLFASHAESEVILIQGVPAAEIAGISHRDRRETRNLALEAASVLQSPELYRIGLVHANVGTQCYAGPVTLDELRISPVDYWALGHMHRRAVLLKKPLTLYCGSLYRLAKEENDQYGINLISVRDGVGSLELLPLNS